MILGIAIAVYSISDYNIMELIKVAVGITTAIVGAYLAWKARGRQYGPVLQKDLEEKILKSTYPAEKSSVCVKRKDKLNIIKIFDAMEKQKTLVVCGPRGCGKTAAVRDSLVGEERVIVVTIGGEDSFDQRLARAITESLELHTNADVSHTEVVKNALRMIKKEGRPPVLVVEVNERFTSNALEKLLGVLKEWGYDNGLVNPVVVLSTSRAALGIKLGIEELRARYVSIGDLDEDDAKSYVKDLCKVLSLEGTNNMEAVSECAEKVVDTIGCRLLHLEGLADSVRLKKSVSEKVTLDDLKELAGKYEHIQLNNSRGALQELHESFPKDKLNEYFFNKPIGTAVDMDDFCKSIGMQQRIVLDKLSGIKPHPFYVDPNTRTVSVGSVFFQKAIDEDYV